MHTPHTVTEAFLEERRRRGQDKKDELWDGVLHMVPPPASRHGSVTVALHHAVHAIARCRGLRAFGEATGVFAPRADGADYRIPDAIIARPEQVSVRGVEGAVLVVEVLSPRDESRAKLPFYAARQIPEVWLLDPMSYAFELLTLTDGAYTPVAATATGWTSPKLDIALVRPQGPGLVIVDGDARYEL